MTNLVAFASLPFGLRGGPYEIATSSGRVVAHISEQQYSPFLSITSRPELAQSIPKDGLGDGFTSYTWYDHPFVLRVVFGRNVASLGSLNSCATIVEPVPTTVDMSNKHDLARRTERFSRVAIAALNDLIAVVRSQGRLYEVFDLNREDIDITVRDDNGRILYDDPLQDSLTEEQEAQSERFDLVHRGDDWYKAVQDHLLREEPVSLADNLLIEAERALAQRFPRQAIATCHTALETAASTLLTRGMMRRGLPNGQIDHLLSTKSLSSKLDGLLRSYTGFSLKRNNRELWRAFSELNEVRNDIVHRGGTPRVADAEFVIRVTRQVIEWLAIVRGRNR